ncbi:MAG: hypothetical protein LC731_05630 [Acidobacteria bacterium]|nr:hypothetical protein [Acidobacteriota bacterium]
MEMDNNVGEPIGRRPSGTTDDAFIDVCFVVPPMADVTWPQIGVSLLKAGIARHGFTSRINYFNLQLAERLGTDFYDSLSDGVPTSLVGEWLFADQIFEAQLPCARDYYENVIKQNREWEDYTWGNKLSSLSHGLITFARRKVMSLSPSCCEGSGTMAMRGPCRES